MASVPVEQHSSDERQRSLAERGRLPTHLFKLMQQQQLQLMTSGASYKICEQPSVA